MKKKAFGAIYQCAKGHKFSAWFFDSKPTQTKCVRCEGMASLVRQIVEKDASQAIEAKKRARAAA